MTGHPRSIVTVNGAQLDFLSWETNNNGYYQADTFTVVFPLTQPVIDGPSWFSSITTAEVIIYDGTPPDPDRYSINNLKLRIQGGADTIEIDPLQHTVRLTGRDYSSRLIDTKVAAPHQNSTASATATEYARICGLSANVVKTSMKIGSYYRIDHVSTKTAKSAWDILCFLAHQEQFIVYVSGTTLNFIPAPAENKARVLTIDDSRRITDAPAPQIRFIRNLTLAHGIVVYVRSWNMKQKKGFTKTARMERSKDPVTKSGQPAAGGEQIYTYVIPNLSADQAQQKANAYLSAISKHEVRVTADDMPGDPTLDPFTPVRWAYAGTQLEQTYFLESVIRRFDFETGYTMSLRGKNHSVESMVQP